MPISAIGRIASISMLFMLLGPMRETAGARRIQSAVGEATPDLTFRRVVDDSELSRQGVVRESIFAMRDFEGFEAMIRPYL